MAAVQSGPSLDTTPPISKLKKIKKKDQNINKYANDSLAVLLDYYIKINQSLALSP
jgi:hypothetical protein